MAAALSWRTHLQPSPPGWLDMAPAVVASGHLIDPAGPEVLGEPLAHEGLDAIRPVDHHPLLRIGQERFEDDLRVEQFGTRSHVPPLPLGIDAAHDLHVLPRHRLRLKPGGFEGRQSRRNAAIDISHSRTGADPRSRWPDCRRRQLPRAGQRCQGRRFRRAWLRLSFVERLSMSNPSSPESHGDVAFQDAVVVLPSDVEAIVAAPPDLISPKDVVDAADRRRVESEIDAVLSGVNDEVARDQVAASLLDRDAVSVSERRLRAITLSTAAGRR